MITTTLGWPHRAQPVRAALGVVLVVCLMLWIQPAAAQEFRLAMSSPPTSMDPHFYTLSPNIRVSGHIFEFLVDLDPDSRPIPRLAESWNLVNDLTWEFHLRHGVKFHDGSEMTAEDVAWSYDRPALIVNSPGKFDFHTRQIVSKVIVDRYTIRFITAAPYPRMLSDVSSIFIVSKKATEGISSDDFASGKGMVGTGPFRFVSFTRDDRVELVRNDAYWGPKPVWSKVTLRFIPQPATRVAALLSKEVDAIENVPPADLARVRENADLVLFSKVSDRVIYIALDQREKSPEVFDKQGKLLPSNPLRDPRVRTALSIGINRVAIKERVMDGLSVPTGNIVPATIFGYDPAISVPKYDVQRARQLLTAAGYPDGFALVLHGPNNRYINDEQIEQAIAGMWTRIGVITKVQASPMADFAPRMGIAKKEFSAYMAGWGGGTLDTFAYLKPLLACEDAAKGYGTSNGGSYCSQPMTSTMEQGLQEMNDAKRLVLLQQASRIALEDAAFIPIHHQVTTWAAQKNITFTPRTDESTEAQYFGLVH